MGHDISQQAQNPDRPLISVIVISYNTREMTLECLRSVVSETSLSYELIVVDNASTDGSAEAIAAEFPDIRLMAETDNHGFAKANNLAITHALGEYVLLLNPDTVVLDRAIDRVHDFAQAHPEAMIWGGRTFFGDGTTLNPYSCWRQMSLWTVFCRTSGLTGLFPDSGFFNAEAYGGWDRGDAREVDIITGCFFLIPRAFWNELGGFDLTYVMYGEETDLCLRARARGARPMITPEASIIHYGGASEAVQSDKMVRLLKAKVTLIDRHFGPATRRLGHGLCMLWPLSRALAVGLLARLTGRGGDSAKSWAEVWARRGEWRGGYALGDRV